MPSSVGPNTFGQENLVFGYDLGDVSNSYKGEPVYNYHDYDKSVMNQTGFNNWSCYDGNYTASYHTWGIAQSRTFVTVDGPDGKDTGAMLYHNFDGGFYGPTDWGGVPAAICTAGNKVTVQGWIKAADAASVGKTVTPYLYFSLNAGGAEAGASNFNLTENWQLVSHTHTLSAAASNYNNILYFFTNAGSAVRMYLTKVAILSGKDHAVQWVPGGTARSVSGSLADLTGNSTIDLTNVSFDSNAQMEFDGTDDFIDLGSSAIWNLGQNGTIETVVRREGAVSTNHRIWCTFNNSSHLDAYLDSTTGGLYLHGGTVGTNTQIPLNQYLHIIIRYSGGTVTIWYNGISQSLTGTTTGYNITNLSYTTLYLGRYVATSGYRWNGRISGFKIYNRALTDLEIQSNYRAVKKRFNI
jgi:hypothetical protein